MVVVFGEGYSDLARENDERSAQEAKRNDEQQGGSPDMLVSEIGTRKCHNDQERCRNAAADGKIDCTIDQSRPALKSGQVDFNTAQRMALIGGCIEAAEPIEDVGQAREQKRNEARDCAQEKRGCNNMGDDLF